MCNNMIKEYAKKKTLYIIIFSYLLKKEKKNHVVNLSQIFGC